MFFGSPGYCSWMPVADFYEGWARINQVLVRRLPELNDEELQLRAHAEGWPIWALIAHLAGMRVYWLCGVFGQPGSESTAFPDPLGELWDDHPEVPRGSAELLFAVESSWRVVEETLARWAPQSLAEIALRDRLGVIQRHTRQSVLTRLVMHDSFHCGEASLILGQHGLPSMDPWEPPR